MVSDFFNNSTSQFASFFAKNADFSIEQLEELQELFGEQISQKKENK